jgi:hypothetical protein
LVSEERLVFHISFDLPAFASDAATKKEIRRRVEQALQGLVTPEEIHPTEDRFVGEAAVLALAFAVPLHLLSHSLLTRRIAKVEGAIEAEREALQDATTELARAMTEIARAYGGQAQVTSPGREHGQ